MKISGIIQECAEKKDCNSYVEISEKKLLEKA